MLALLLVSTFEMILGGFALLVVAAVILMLAAPTVFVHKMTGDKTSDLEEERKARRNSPAN